MDRHLKQLETKDFDCEEIESVSYGKAVCIPYNELSNFDCVDALFEHYGRDSIAILYRETDLFGHWVLLSRYHDKNGFSILEFFDSLGYSVDDELKEIPEQKREELDENVKYLSNLVTLAIRDGYSFRWNKQRLQKDEKNIETCGRWVSLRSFYLPVYDETGTSPARTSQPEDQDGMSLPKFQETFKKYKGLDGDEIVTMFTGVF